LFGAEVIHCVIWPVVLSYHYVRCVFLFSGPLFDVYESLLMKRALCFFNLLNPTHWLRYPLINGPLAIQPVQKLPMNFLVSKLCPWFT